MFHVSQWFVGFGWFFFLKGEKSGGKQGSMGFIPLGISVPDMDDMVRCHQKGPSKLVENVKVINLVILPPKAICETASACVQ